MNEEQNTEPADSASKSPPADNSGSRERWRQFVFGGMAGVLVPVAAVIAFFVVCGLTRVVLPPTDLQGEFRAMGIGLLGIVAVMLGYWISQRRK
jgi:high-affinity Fe2+/Pb2+ permease